MNNDLEIEILRIKVALGHAIDAIKSLGKGDQPAADEQLREASSKLLGS